MIIVANIFASTPESCHSFHHTQSLLSAEFTPWYWFVTVYYAKNYYVVIWWRHQMETFQRYWPFVRGIHRSPVNYPHKGQRRGALIFSLICAWTDGWANNRDACDLRLYCVHYDVNFMRTVYANQLATSLLMCILRPNRTASPLFVWHCCWEILLVLPILFRDTLLKFYHSASEAALKFVVCI